MKYTCRNGFTLVETIFYIALLGLIVALATPITMISRKNLSGFKVTTDAFEEVSIGLEQIHNELSAADYVINSFNYTSFSNTKVLPILICNVEKSETSEKDSYSYINYVFKDKTIKRLKQFSKFGPEYYNNKNRINLTQGDLGFNTIINNIDSVKCTWDENNLNLELKTYNLDSVFIKSYHLANLYVYE